MRFVGKGGRSFFCLPSSCPPVPFSVFLSSWVWLNLWLAFTSSCKLASVTWIHSHTLVSFTLLLNATFKRWKLKVRPVLGGYSYTSCFQYLSFGYYIFYSRYNTDISALNISWYRYQSNISTQWLTHPFITFSVSNSNIAACCVGMWTTIIYF